MIEKLYQEICEDKDVRQNLIALRGALAGEEDVKRFARLLGGDFDVLTGLLDREDPKVRRNAALILGEMETEDVLPFLFHAWEKEETLYVRADYLRAMKKLDCSPYHKAFAKRRDELLRAEVSAEAGKHVREELHALDALLAVGGSTRKHVFTGGKNGTADVILVTGPFVREATARQIHTGTVRLLHSAVRVDGADLNEVLAIRTYVRILFPFEADPVISADAAKAGEELGALQIPKVLDGLHDGGGVYRYRIDVRVEADAREKAKFIRRCCERLERACAGRLMNSASDYEVEIRLVGRKDGSYIPMLSLFTIPDRRFAYRKEYVADSISPVQAAAVMQLAKPYLREGAQVLDPFCGVGTMLVERNYCVQASDLYGLDLYGDAIEKARANTKITGMQIHYINRDYLTFRHDYLFDEIVSDLPNRSSSPELTLVQLYERFLVKSADVLADQAVLVLYTMQPALLEACLKSQQERYVIKAKYPMLRDGKAAVFILEHHADRP